MCGGLEFRVPGLGVHETRVSTATCLLPWRRLGVAELPEKLAKDRVQRKRRPEP